MKKTFTVNISGVQFAIDEDAYKMLSAYLEDIEFRLKAQNEDSETMRDIETRIMEILRERGVTADRVVNIEMVKSVISIIGNPSVFGGNSQTSATEGEPAYKYIAKKLMRNPNDKMAGGVCSGLASYYSLETNLVRFVFLLCFLFFGLSIWVYVILWIIIPLASTHEEIDMLNRSKK